MTVSQLMTGLTPDAEFEGFATADDMVLAVDFSGVAETPASYIVAQEGITEQSGALSPESKDSTYIRTGKSSTKTSTARTFTISGDRYMGDAFQDALLAHALKYGTGQTVIKPYVYFNRLTGKGEQGKVSVAIEDDLSGAAGENASFSATLTAVGTPTEYTYSAPTG